MSDLLTAVNFTDLITDFATAIGPVIAVVIGAGLGFVALRVLFRWVKGFVK